jgi:hypothetical protein
MKTTNALIERMYEVNTGYQQLEISLEDDIGRIKPGQTVLVQTTPNMHPYLLDHWWPVNIKRGFWIIERPINETYQIGQVLTVLGLVGQPYRFRRNLRNVLLVAYNTPPTALLMTIPWLLGNNISVTMVLTGTSRHYTTKHIDERVEIILGEDDFAWPNQVMNAGWADQVFVTVSEEDEREHFVEVYQRFEDIRATIAPNYLFGVFRPTLPCGSGACGACWAETRKGDKLVCVDGPAFDLTQIIKPVTAR